MILKKIYSYKKEELEHFKRQMSFADLKAKVMDQAPTLDFTRALKESRNPFSIIAEIKKQSPSKGVICEKFNPVAIAQAYAEAGAVAISVLTDQHFFGGTLGDLRQVRQKVSIPLLRKDFIWDPYQVYAAREAGADAILLIVAMLGQSQIEDLLGLSDEMDLQVLVEVHNEEECKRLTHIDAGLIGINNRDLQTFQVDVETSARLLPYLPREAVKVSESGLDQKEVLQKLKDLGIHAFLIGEAFMKEERPGEALKNLIKT